jgi:hypothetical protein
VADDFDEHQDNGDGSNVVEKVCRGLHRGDLLPMDA